MALVVDPDSNWWIRQRQPGGTPDNDVSVKILVIRSGLKDGAGTFEGIAQWDGRQGDFGGQLSDRSIHFMITWPDQTVGDYYGYWYTDGYLRGHTVNLSNPSESAEWWSAENNFTQVDR